MALQGGMILKDTQGKLLTTQLDAAIPAGFNGGTPLVPDCRITVTAASSGLWKNAGLSYDTAGRLAVTSVGPPIDWVGGIPLDNKGRVFISNDSVYLYSQDGIPITFSGAVSMGASYAPEDMFANGEEGVWYDPSDLTTMFQDTAGTIPVTMAGQPVGKILDKSGNGHHATSRSGSTTLQRDPTGLYYLSNFDMVTGDIDFTVTDKMTVWAGVRKFFSDTLYYL